MQPKSPHPADHNALTRHKGSCQIRKDRRSKRSPKVIETPLKEGSKVITFFKMLLRIAFVCFVSSVLSLQLKTEFDVEELSESLRSGDLIPRTTNQ